MWARNRFLFSFCLSRYYSYLNSARQILSTYKGEEPFSSFLKKYFAVNKKYGSKDRKQVSHLCYCFFRLGKAAPRASEDAIVAALFLCSTEENQLLAALKPDWNAQVSLPVTAKYSIINPRYSILNLFPWKKELSEGIEYEKFCESFLAQPDLFLRLRPGKETVVKKKLQNAGISFVQLTDSCLALSNAAKADSVIELNKEAVVQDYSSQQTGDFFRLMTNDSRRLTIAWDCCAASGGKSIMAKDMLGDISLTVSDIRESSIANLKKRFGEAGITNYRSFVADVTEENFTPPVSNFNLIICDAPCTGSGTWSRTPEQLYYFDQNAISPYGKLQQKIVANVYPHLSAGGYLLYITCSVFTKENEEIVKFIEQSGAEKIKAGIIKGYEQKADSMFVALLRKPG